MTTINRRQLLSFGAATAAVAVLPKGDKPSPPLADFTYIDANMVPTFDEPSRAALFDWIHAHGMQENDLYSLAVRGQVAKFWTAHPPHVVIRKRIVRSLPDLKSAIR